MSNTERPPFQREAREFSVTGQFESVLRLFCYSEFTTYEDGYPDMAWSIARERGTLHSENDFYETLDDGTLAIALIGAGDSVYDVTLQCCMNVDRRERILAIISQSHDVTEKDMKDAQLLILDAASKYERANYAKNHIFSRYDVEEMGDVEFLAISDGILEIEDQVFDEYVEKRNYNLVAEERIAGWRDHTIKPGIQTVVFPDSLKRIEDRAFFNMVCLKNIHFGNSLEHIGEFAFYSCRLGKIELPGSIKDIGESAFATCFCLESVKLSEGIEVISEQMFYRCTSLREVVLPSTIKEIGKHAFLACYDLGKINLPEGLTVIAEGVFADCTSLKEIYIPKSVIQIEDNAFGSCWHESCEVDLVVICHQDSFAHQYAIENNLKFKLVTV